MRRLALLAAVAALALPGLAAAHVTVTPDTAQSGQQVKLTFNVANERDAATTGIQVFLPEDVTVDRVQPHPGWRYSLDLGEQPELDWAARTHRAQISGDETASFTFTTGPLPAVDRLVFKVLQTYADGTVVRWIQEPDPGGDPPERPAPTVEISNVAVGPRLQGRRTRTTARTAPPCGSGSSWPQRCGPSQVVRCSTSAAAASAERHMRGRVAYAGARTCTGRGFRVRHPLVLVAVLSIAATASLAAGAAGPGGWSTSATARRGRPR